MVFLAYLPPRFILAILANLVILVIFVNLGILAISVVCANVAIFADLVFLAIRLLRFFWSFRPFRSI